MRNWLKDQQVLAIIIGGVAATIITAWVINSWQAGPACWPIRGLVLGALSLSAALRSSS